MSRRGRAPTIERSAVDHCVTNSTFDSLCTRAPGRRFVTRFRCKLSRASGKRLAFDVARCSTWSCSADALPHSSCVSVTLQRCNIDGHTLSFTTKAHAALASFSSIVHSVVRGFNIGTVDPKSRGAVLVVDDGEDVRSELRDLLESEGYLVLEARDGKEALNTLSSGTTPGIRLIVLDLMMPFMSGWELVDLLRRDPTLPQIPVLVMSGMPVHGDASGIGATMSWIRKPFGEDPFLTAVRETIESARASNGGDKMRRRSTRPSAPSHHDM